LPDAVLAGRDLSLLNVQANHDAAVADYPQKAEYPYFADNEACSADPMLKGGRRIVSAKSVNVANCGYKEECMTWLLRWGSLSVGIKPHRKYPHFDG
jgi:hypothetical protein